MSVTGNVTVPIYAFILLAVAVRIAGGLFVMLPCLYISTRQENVLSVMLISSAVLILPALHAISGLESLKWISI